MIGIDSEYYFSTRIAKGSIEVIHNLSDLQLVSATRCLKQGQTDLGVQQGKSLLVFRLGKSFC